MPTWRTPALRGRLGANGNPGNSAARKNRNRSSSDCPAAMAYHRTQSAISHVRMLEQHRKESMTTKTTETSSTGSPFLRLGLVVLAPCARLGAPLAAPGPPRRRLGDEGRSRCLDSAHGDVRGGSMDGPREAGRQFGEQRAARVCGCRRGRTGVGQLPL